MLNSTISVLMDFSMVFCTIVGAITMLVILAFASKYLFKGIRKYGMYIVVAILAVLMLFIKLLNVILKLCLSIISVTKKSVSNSGHKAIELTGK